jgi:fructose-specific component phosphotransferase system IIB-like protein
MTATMVLILVLAYGIGGAVCLMLGLVIGAAARRPEQREVHEMDNDEPPVRVSIWQGRDF